MKEEEGFEYPLYDLAEGRVFDPLSGEIREGLKTLIKLSPLETRALEALVMHPDKVVVYETLVRRLYPEQWEYAEDLLNPGRYQTVIRRLRAQLRAVSPDLAAKLETFPKRGYRWTVNILPPEV